MKSKVLTVFVLIFSTCLGLAQNFNNVYEIRDAIDFYRSNKMMSGEWNTGTLTEKDIDGSPYLTDEFIAGSIFTIQKQEFVNIPVRYNIFNDQLEFKTESGEVQALATPEIVEKVEFGDYKMDYLPYTYSQKIRNGFFIILSEGTASLYAKKEVTFKEAVPPGAYKEPEPAKFVNNSDKYFIRIGNNEAKIVGNKKDLMDIFPDHQKEIEEFIKKNKTKAGKVENLIELVEFYNSL